MSTLSVQASATGSATDTAVVRRESRGVALAVDGHGQRPASQRGAMLAARVSGMPAGPSPVVVIAVDAATIVYDDLDLRSSLGGLPRTHALAAGLSFGDPYAPVEEASRGGLVDRYV